MLTTKKLKLKDRAGYEKQSFISWIKGNEEEKLRKRYVIEYCTDAKKFERVGADLEIDDAYHQIVLEETQEEKFCSFDGIAMAFYISFYMRKDVLDVKMYEEIYKGSEFIHERYIEVPSTFASTIEKIVVSETKTALEMLQSEVKYLKEENERLRNFISAYHAEQAYEKYRREATA
jgi:hypothetical protein